MVSFSTAVALSLLVGCHGIVMKGAEKVQAEEEYEEEDEMDKNGDDMPMLYDRAAMDELQAEFDQWKKGEKTNAFTKMQELMQLKGMLGGKHSFKQGPSPLVAFNCTAFPEFCQAPFNCQRNSLPIVDWMNKGYGFKGHADMGVWCLSPVYGQYMEQCIVKKDLVQAAHTQYDNLVEGVMGGHVALEGTASYCFVEGLCKDTDVTAETTLEQAEAICDKKLGHNTWTSFGSIWNVKSKASVSERFQALIKDRHFSKRSQTSALLAGSCASGNYHCDVMLCKETFCQNQKWIDKYGYLEEENIKADSLRKRGLGGFMGWSYER